MGDKASGGTQAHLMRSIVEEQWTSDALAQARENWSGADLAWEAITWIAAHDPEGGDKISESSQVRDDSVRGQIDLHAQYHNPLSD